VGLDGLGDGVQVLAVELASSDAEVGTATYRPSAHAHPVELLDLTLHQPLEAVAHAEREMPLVEGQPGGDARRSVHARGEAPGVDDGQSLAVHVARRRGDRDLDERSQRGE
jgi:hypothetical protein